MRAVRFQGSGGVTLETAAQIESGWAAGLMEFERRRASFLLYSE